MAAGHPFASPTPEASDDAWCADQETQSVCGARCRTQEPPDACARRCRLRPTEDLRDFTPLLSLAVKVTWHRYLASWFWSLMQARSVCELPPADLVYPAASKPKYQLDAPNRDTIAGQLIYQFRCEGALALFSFCYQLLTFAASSLSDSCK